MISAEIDDEIDGDFDTIQRTEMEDSIDQPKSKETNQPSPYTDSAFHESHDNNSFDDSE